MIREDYPGHDGRQGQNLRGCGGRGAGDGGELRWRWRWLLGQPAELVLVLEDDPDAAEAAVRYGHGEHEVVFLDVAPAVELRGIDAVPVVVLAPVVAAVLNRRQAGQLLDGGPVEDGLAGVLRAQDVDGSGEAAGVSVLGEGGEAVDCVRDVGEDLVEGLGDVGDGFGVHGFISWELFY